MSEFLSIQVEELLNLILPIFNIILVIYFGGISSNVFSYFLGQFLVFLNFLSHYDGWWNLMSHCNGKLEVHDSGQLILTGIVSGTLFLLF